jgi:PAS domain S-box-containing protein
MIYRHGYLSECNAVMAQMYGFSGPDDLAGVRLSDLLPPTDPQNVEYLRAFIRSSYRLVDAESREPDRYGDTRYFLNNLIGIVESGFLLRAWGTQRDITERKRAEEALGESERRYRELFEQDLAGVCISSPDGTMLACNPAFGRIFGFRSADSAIECNLASLYEGTNTHGELLGQLEELCKLENLESRMRRLDGAPVHVIQNIIGTFDESGQLVQVKSYLLDLTERKSLENQLRQAQKMEAVGRLAGGVAHDFNNVLTAIIGHSDLLLHRIEANDPTRPDIEEIRKAGERATRLTRQLLAFSRRQVLQLQVLDLNSVVGDMEGMLRRLIGEDIELVVSQAASLESVRADAGQMEQVIMNLAVNARDAMPTGGKLTIETANVDLDEEYARTHVGIHPGSYVMVAISDTGVGMDKETQLRIFEPFFTTKEPGKGTGLGLSTVYGIVKQMGGNVWVYSGPQHGTTFKIYLPRVQEEVRKPLVERGSVAPAGGNETILLVEDDEGVRGLICAVLKAAGYNVLEAATGSEALHICDRYHGPLHLIITDVVMPQMSGRELVGRLSALRPETKVLFISGYTDDAVVHHGVIEAGTSFLQKPFTPQALARKVRETLDLPHFS